MDRARAHRAAARSSGSAAALAALALLAAGGCHETDPVDACMGVDCSGHGTCVIERVHAICLCDPGYVAEGLECVPDTVSGAWVLMELEEPVEIALLGSPESEEGRADDEVRHEVVLTHDFVIAETEVTQEQFEARMGRAPATFDRCGPTCPVEGVTWHEAAAYCNLLSDEAGLARCYECTGEGEDVTCELAARFGSPADCPSYRLPTEAEWEVAARAGTTTATWNGDLDAAHLECEQPNPVLDGIAAFCGTSPYAPQRVGELAESPSHVYDLLGNVAEWCHDWYGSYPNPIPADPGGPESGEERVVRGGSWDDPARLVRAAARGHAPPGERLSTVGFRPVRTM